jgi:predicted ester cyclase
VSEENKALVRRYMDVIDANESCDWDVLDEFLAPEFISHGGLPPGIASDRNGMKQAAEIFRQATPGKHVIVDQIAEGDRVVSRIRGSGQHVGDHLGIPASGSAIEVEGVVIHRIKEGQIVEHWALVDMAALLQQAGVLPEPPADLAES